MKIVRRIHPGDVIPRWWGAVRQDYTRLELVIAPIGLNVVLRIGWIVYCWFLFPFRNYRPFMDRTRREIHDQLSQHFRDAYQRREKELDEREIRIGARVQAEVRHRLAAAVKREMDRLQAPSATRLGPDAKEPHQ